MPEPPPMAPVPPQMAAPTASMPAPTQKAPVPSQMGVPVSMPSIQTLYYSYSPSLFPTSIFPSVMQPMSVAQTPKEMRVEARESRESRDELVELGALFVLLKLAFG